MSSNLKAQIAVIFEIAKILIFIGISIITLLISINVLNHKFQIWIIFSAIIIYMIVFPSLRILFKIPSAPSNSIKTRVKWAKEGTAVYSKGDLKNGYIHILLGIIIVFILALLYLQTYYLK